MPCKVVRDMEIRPLLPFLFQTLILSLIVLKGVKSQGGQQDYDAAPASDSYSGRLKRDEEFSLGGQRQDVLEGKVSKANEGKDSLSPAKSGMYRPQPFISSQSPSSGTNPIARNYQDTLGTKQQQCIFSSAGKMLPSYLAVSMLKQRPHSFKNPNLQNNSIFETSKTLYPAMGRTNSEYEQLMLRKLVTNPVPLDYMNRSQNLDTKRSQSDQLSGQYEENDMSSEKYSGQNQMTDKKPFYRESYELSNKFMPRKGLAMSPRYSTEYDRNSVNNSFRESQNSEKNLMNSTPETEYKDDGKSQSWVRQSQELEDGFERPNINSQTDPPDSGVERLTTKYTQSDVQDSQKQEIDYNSNQILDKYKQERPLEVQMPPKYFQTNEDYERYYRPELHPERNLSNQDSENMKRAEVTDLRMNPTLASENYSQSETLKRQNLEINSKQSQEEEPSEDQPVLHASEQKRSQGSYLQEKQQPQTYEHLYRPNEQILQSYSHFNSRSENNKHPGFPEKQNAQDVSNFKEPMGKYEDPTELREFPAIYSQKYQKTDTYLQHRQEGQRSDSYLQPKQNLDFYRQRQPLTKQMLQNYTQQQFAPERYSQVESSEGASLEAEPNPHQDLDRYKVQETSEPQALTDSENKLAQSSDNQRLINYPQLKFVLESYSQGESSKGEKLEVYRNSHQHFDKFKEQGSSVPEVSSDSRQIKLAQSPSTDNQMLLSLYELKQGAERSLSNKTEKDKMLGSHSRRDQQLENNITKGSEELELDNKFRSEEVNLKRGIDYAEKYPDWAVPLQSDPAGSGQQQQGPHSIRKYGERSSSEQAEDGTERMEGGYLANEKKRIVD